jgi:hypothetical protein
MSFTVGFSKQAKEKKPTTKQKLIAAAPVLVGSAGAGYGVHHFANEAIQNHSALLHARQAVHAAKHHGMESAIYQTHKAHARKSMMASIKHGKKAKIGGGIYLAGALTSAALGYKRTKEQTEKNKKAALAKKATMTKTALSREILQRATQAASKKVELIPPGMRGYAGVKPVQQLDRFQKALSGKK